MKTRTRTRSSARKQIERFAAMLEAKIKSLTWTPLYNGGEMQGDAGGWELILKDGSSVYGYNADDLCRNLLLHMRHQDWQQIHQDGHDSGLQNAAKEKDAVIEELKRKLVAGDRTDVQRVINEFVVRGIGQLIRAVWQSGWCEPPMRDMWILQELLRRHAGQRWNSNLYKAPDTPIVFEPLAKEERRKFCDSHPWQDLAIIRKAAQTEDTQAIVSLVNKGRWVDPDTLAGTPAAEDNSPETCLACLLLIDLRSEYMSDLADTQGTSRIETIVRGWTEQQRKEAIDYAGAVHLAASDNDSVKIPPCPEHVKPLRPEVVAAAAAKGGGA